MLTYTKEVAAPTTTSKNIRSSNGKNNKSTSKASPRFLSDSEKMLYDKNHKELKQLLEKYSVNLSKELPPPPIALEVIGKTGNASIGNYGGITLITAKAKSGKTFAASLIASAFIKGDLLHQKLLPHITGSKNQIYYIDTEQSAYHVHKVGKRINQLSERIKPPNLKIFKLRATPIEGKQKLIERLIYSSPNLAVVIIDGVKDLLLDINNAEQSTNTVSNLLKWAEERKILIIAILHQNKNDTNARGHFGTELKNKAEVIVNIIKHATKNIFLVKSEDCRDKEFETFAFNIDDMGLPLILFEWEDAAKEKRTPIDPKTMDDQVHKNLLKAIFRDAAAAPKYGDLITLIIKYFTQVGVVFGKNKAKEFKQYYEEKKWIETFKSNSSTYPIYKLTTESV